MSADQLRLFAQELGAEFPQTAEPDNKESDSHNDPPPGGSSSSGREKSKPRGRKQLPAHLKRERIVHDLAEEDKHCSACHQDLRRIGEEVSERDEYIPAQLLVIGRRLSEVRLRLHTKDSPANLHSPSERVRRARVCWRM